MSKKSKKPKKSKAKLKKPREYIIDRDNDHKGITYHVSRIQFITLTWLVERGYGKNVGNLAYLALQTYVKNVIDDNPLLRKELTKYLYKMQDKEPIIKFRGINFEPIPQEATSSQT